MLAIVFFLIWFVLDRQKRKKLAKGFAKVGWALILATGGLLALVFIERLVNFVLHGQ